MVRQRMHVRHTGVADAVTSVAPTAATTSRSIVIRCTMRPLGYAELSKNCTSIPVIAELSKCSTKNDFREKKIEKKFNFLVIRANILLLLPPRCTRQVMQWWLSGRCSTRESRRNAFSRDVDLDMSPLSHHCILIM